MLQAFVRLDLLGIHENIPNLNSDSIWDIPRYIMLISLLKDSQLQSRII